MSRFTHAGLAALALVAIAPFAAAQEPGTTDAAKIKGQATAAWEAQDWEEAAAAYAELVEIYPKEGSAWHRLGYALHALGRYDEALKAHLACAKLPGTAAVGTYNAACVYSIKNEKEKALDLLGKAIDAGFSDAGLLATDGDLDNIRGEAQFATLAKKLKESPAKPKFTAYTPITERACARLAYFGQNGSPGQLAIDYGRPAWSEKFEQAIESGKFAGQRWRLGADFWTTVDSSFAFELEGVEIPAGQHYLVATADQDGRFKLVFLDPAECRAKKLDAYVANRTEGGIEVPVGHEKTDEVAERLEIGLKAKEGGAMAKLYVHFGPHVLYGTLTPKLDY